jgi:hypothetical protein
MTNSRPSTMRRLSADLSLRPVVVIASTSWHVPPSAGGYAFEIGVGASRSALEHRPKALEQPSQVDAVLFAETANLLLLEPQNSFDLFV